MRQTGVVTSVDGNRARVLMQKHSSCSNCGACKMGDEKMEMEIDAINKAKAQTGDEVEVDMENQNVLKAAFIIYVIPLISLLIGIIVGSSVLAIMNIERYSDFIAGGVGFIFLGISYLVIKLKEKNFKGDTQFTPIITKTVEKEPI